MLQMWSKIIYNSGNQSIQEISDNQLKFEKVYNRQIAEGLYEDIQENWHINTSPVTKIRKFKLLSEPEKKFWYKYSSEIPGKLKTLKLFVRPFEEFCRTCIITEQEISSLVQIDFERYCRDLSSNRLTNKNSGKNVKGGHPDQKSFIEKITERRRFYFELNYLIPIQLKKAGYEIIRHEEATEIDKTVINKLARAIHSKYLQELRNQRARNEDGQDGYIFYNPSNTEVPYTSDFDDLPNDIKHSNIDNALHIPTKLLSIGYKIREVKKGLKPVSLHLNEDEIETMARVEHLRWSWEKRLNGWKYGKIKDTIKKTHPSLIPYEELVESEKDKDRELVKLIPAFLSDIKYEAYPVSPNRINKLSYAIKPQSNIQKLLSETRKLSDEVNSLVLTSPEIHEKIMAINYKIEETIKEVQGSYNYARHIQEIFLPEDLFIRECFPESFILYKPKNIVSGDFYFFSKHDDSVIFTLADCTGHGIPGALISSIGYGSLDQVVNVNKLSEPSEILHSLYAIVHRFMRRNIDGHGLQDDMDITQCKIDTKTNILTYAGVGNLIYHISGGKIVEIKSEYYKDDCNQKQEYRFTSKNIEMKIGDKLYLSSDGYPDQLGGEKHKRFQKKQLMDLLLKINELPMAEQSDILNEEIERWRETNEEDQTDDISIIGIRI